LYGNFASITKSISFIGGNPMAKKILHLEGLAVFGLSLYLYWLNDYSWLLFFLLILAPDLSMIGYLVNDAFGAKLYNLFHTYIISLAVIFIGMFFSNSTLLAVGIIWTAHIGMDRLVGYGLKYPTHFKDNHLNQL